MQDIFNPSEQHHQLRKVVRDFATRELTERARVHDEEEKFDRESFEKLAELGLFGLTIPEEYGGAGLDPTAAVIVHEELSAIDPGLTLSYLVQSMLFINNLFVNGNDAQRRKYLPSAIAGKTICGMCMSEPAAGTDVLGLTTEAELRGDHYSLRGTKMWITNGAVNDTQAGDCYMVYTRLKGHPRNQLTMFVVESTFPGFSLGQRIKGKLGMRSSPTAELVFDNCRVPLENRVGEEGKATICMMRNLELERITLASMSVGIARRCVEIMNRYASERVSFGQPIREFGQIQRHIAESYAEYMAARSYVYVTASHMDLNTPGHRLDTDGVKLFASTAAKNIADRAIQVLGGYGYVAEYDVERLWRDAKLLEIGGGTLEAHQKNMEREMRRIGDFL